MRHLEADMGQGPEGISAIGYHSMCADEKLMGLKW